LATSRQSLTSDGSLGMGQAAKPQLTV